MFGQILTGFAQPFVLAAPTRYSDLWFTNRGRVAATAVMSLANPFGGALAQLIDPFWANSASDIPNMVLYISIIVSLHDLFFTYKLLTDILVFHCNHSIILYSFTPSKALFAVWNANKTTTYALSPRLIRIPRILDDHDTIHDLRCSLQHYLLAD